METANTVQSSPPHIVVCPSPGMGHLIPLTEFAKRLVHFGFTFTIAIPNSGPPSSSQTDFLSAVNATTSGAIDSTFLSPVDISDLSSAVKMETIFSHMMVRSILSLREVLVDLTKKKRVVVLLVDIFGTDVFDLARDFNLRPYIIFTSTAMALSLFLWLDKLDSLVSCEYREMDEPVKIPGCVPVHGKDLLDPLQDRKDEVYKWMLHHTSRYWLADGIIENSFEALEYGAIKLLTQSEPGKPVVYPVGPIVQTGPGDGDSAGWGLMKWLDEQPNRSVLFVNFGSAGSLSCEQQHELAVGLEMSGIRFLWVVKSSNDSQASATYFSPDGEKDPLAFLPEGFLERTKGRGLAVPKWAPQMRVLTHAAVGGFLTHCGWNSMLESVVNGVPFICWPLFAEQKMNAVLLTEDLRVGLRPVAGDDGVVRREEIARVTKELMEGEERKMIRNRMSELKDAAEYALSENGTSTMALNEIAIKWKSLM